MIHGNTPDVTDNLPECYRGFTERELLRLIIVRWLVRRGRITETPQEWKVLRRERAAK